MSRTSSVRGLSTVSDIGSTMLLASLLNRSEHRAAGTRPRSSRMFPGRIAKILIKACYPTFESAALSHVIMGNNFRIETVISLLFTSGVEGGGNSTMLNFCCDNSFCPKNADRTGYFGGRVIM